MIQVVNRALDILEHVAKNRERDHSLSEIADQFGLHRATCANIIKTLVNRNYLEKMDRRRGYRLGRMAYYLGGNYSFKRDLIEAAAGTMKQFRKKLNEGCILAVLRKNNRVIIHEEKSFHELRVHNIREKNAYDTSTGRLILAYLSKPDQHRYVQKYGLPGQGIWPEVEDEEDLINALARIKKRGVAKQVSAAHIVGLAVPVVQGGGQVAALGIYLPESRFLPSKRDYILSELRQAAEQIHQQLSIMEKGDA